MPLAKPEITAINMICAFGTSDSLKNSSNFIQIINDRRGNPLWLPPMGILFFASCLKNLQWYTSSEGERVSL